MAKVFDVVSNKFMLGAFGVEGSEDGDGSHSFAMFRG